MTKHRPHVVVLAGPNGAGKSTAAPALLRGRLGVTEFVNADTIARGEGTQRIVVADRELWSRIKEASHV